MESESNVAQQGVSRCDALHSHSSDSLKKKQEEQGSQKAGVLGSSFCIFALLLGSKLSDFPLPLPFKDFWLFTREVPCL